MCILFLLLLKKSTAPGYKIHIAKSPQLKKWLDENELLALAILEQHKTEREDES